MKYFMIILVIISIFGCDGHFGDEISTVTIEKDETGKCGCLSLHTPVYVKSTHKKPIEVVIRKSYSRDFDSSTKKIKLKSKERRYLGCDAILPKTAYPGSNNCSVEVSYSVVSSTQVRYPIVENIQLASNANIASITRGYVINNKQCKRECVTPEHVDNEGECIVLKNNLSTNHSRNFSTAISLAMARQGKAVTKSELMSIFGVKKDPCERSDLDLSGGYVSNSGKSCVLTTMFGSFQNSDLTAELHLPRNLKGRFNKADDSIYANFESTDMAATIDFPNKPDLTKDYGGMVVKMESLPEMFILSTENGCIGWEPETN